MFFKRRARRESAEERGDIDLQNRARRVFWGTQRKDLMNAEMWIAEDTATSATLIQQKAQTNIAILILFPAKS